MTNSIIFITLVLAICGLIFVFKKSKKDENEPTDNLTQNDTQRKQEIKDVYSEADGFSSNSENCLEEERKKNLNVLFDVRIRYKDFEDMETEHIVSVTECDPLNPKGYLIGYSHTEEGEKTFRINEIFNATIPDTGEVIKDIPNYAKEKLIETLPPKLKDILKKSFEKICILFYVGNVDGFLTEKEKDVLLNFCRDNLGTKDINANDLKIMSKKIPILSLNAFYVACENLSKITDEEKNELYKAAEEMAKAKKNSGNGFTVVQLIKKYLLLKDGELPKKADFKTTISI